MYRPLMTSNWSSVNDLVEDNLPPKMGGSIKRMTLVRLLTNCCSHSTALSIIVVCFVPLWFHAVKWFFKGHEIEFKQVGVSTASCCTNHVVLLVTPSNTESQVNTRQLFCDFVVALYFVARLSDIEV